MPVSYIFRGYKAPLYSIVSDAISSELPYTFFAFDRVHTVRHCGLNK